MTETMQPPRMSRGFPWRPVVWGGAGLLLLLPWVAMRFTGEVAWSAGDFILFGAMLLAACIAFELIARVARSGVHLIAAAIAVGTAFLLVWANLAVGIIGSEGHPANLMYLGVLATGVIGAAVARLRPAGMARALIAVAVGQALVAAIAPVVLRAGWEKTLVANGVFIALWLVSALLFRKAAHDRSSPGAADRRHRSGASIH